MPYDLHVDVALPGLIATWLTQGPPAPRPERFRVDAAQLDDAARRLRRVDGPELSALRELDRQCLVAYHIDDWTLMVCTGVEDEDGGLDRLLLRHRDAHPTVILMNDPWNPPSRFSVDGDPVTFRGVMDWWRALIQRAGLDEAIRVPGESDELQTIAVTEWLRFWDGDRERRSLALVDRRLQGDSTVAAPFWSNGIYGSTAERATELRRGTAVYYAFIRQLIDPSFSPPGVA